VASSSDTGLPTNNLLPIHLIKHSKTRDKDSYFYLKTMASMRPLPTAAKAFVTLIVAIQCRSSTSFAVRSPKATAGLVGSTFLSAGESEERDLFEYFDPLLSPHAYPNGISPDTKPVTPESSFNPPGFDPFGLNEKVSKKSAPSEAEKADRGFDPFGLGERVSKKSAPSEAEKAARPEVDPSVVFDPTISPHAYTDGVPSVIVGDAGAATAVQKKVGVLLMDHGSKNPRANQRLLDLAALYQDKVGTSQIVVRAAHMEIAEPSIPEGLQSLLDAGVDEIVCHPYFLSPGRHVVEDIPEILKNAIETLQIDIPITTTDPVGSNTDVMIGAIHGLVQKSATSMPRNNN
jgi:hypothetical protein